MSPWWRHVIVCFQCQSSVPVRYQSRFVVWCARQSHRHASEAVTDWMSLVWQLCRLGYSVTRLAQARQTVLVIWSCSCGWWIRGRLGSRNLRLTFMWYIYIINTDIAWWVGHIVVRLLNLYAVSIYIYTYSVIGPSVFLNMNSFSDDSPMSPLSYYYCHAVSACTETWEVSVCCSIVQRKEN